MLFYVKLEGSRYFLAKFRNDGKRGNLIPIAPLLKEKIIIPILRKIQIRAAGYSISLHFS